MKSKKKDIFYTSIGAIFILCVIFIVIYLLPSYNFILCSDVAIVKYEIYDNNIYQEISEEDSEIIKSLFSGKWSYFDNPSCGFSEDASIIFGSEVFLPACDGDPIIKYGSKYFAISDKERRDLDKILKKYGAIFPCP